MQPTKVIADCCDLARCDCRRFCAPKASEFNESQQCSTTDVQQVQYQAVGNDKISIDFTKVWNLVRDQGVGGSNPLSPTNLYNATQAISDMTPTGAADSSPRPEGQSLAGAEATTMVQSHTENFGSPSTTLVFSFGVSPLRHMGARNLTR